LFSLRLNNITHCPGTNCYKSRALWRHQPYGIG